MKKLYLSKRIFACAMAATMAFSVSNVPLTLNHNDYKRILQQVKAAEGTDETVVEKPFYTADKEITEPEFEQATEDWNADAFTLDESIADVTVTENFVMKATVTIDEAGYKSLAGENDKEKNHLKVQAVTKLGAEWTWTDSQDIPYLTQDKFEKDGDNYKSDIEIKFSDITPDELKGVYFKIIAQGYKGLVKISNVSLSEVKKATTKEVLAYESQAEKTASIDFSELIEEDWEKTIKQLDLEDPENVTVTENMNVKGTVEIDKELYDSLSAEGSYIKLQSVVKTGEDWDWNQGGKYPYLSQNSFKEKDGKYVADFEDSFNDLKGMDVKSIIFRVVGIGAKGNVTIKNVSLYNLVPTQDVELPVKDPQVVDDFEGVTEGTSGWVEEEGYAYQGTVDLSLAKQNDSNMLKVGLDYSKDSNVSWSEAKIKKTLAEPVDVSAYNQFTYDIIYPEALEGKMKAKVFAKNADGEGTTIIEKDIEVKKEKDLGDGMKKATVAIKFSPNTLPISEITLGIVGVSTDFKGDIYLDNLTFSQINAAADYVDITATPDNANATKADTSKMPEKVKLSDANATAKTKALYSYLKGLDEADQVLFGHQNDTHKHVSKATGVYSDTKDVTGSISGVVGIDTLALTGDELGEKDVDKAIAKSVEIGKSATKEGAILTLSAHMPNMGNEKIKATPDADRKYDFSACGFEESKDTSGNCAQEVLPGGKYNDQFKAYLDIIADYAKGLGDDIPVLFRPFHENDGGWFWWGAASTDKETFKAMYRYMEDYLTNEKGVHNFIYVYSPNGPVSSEEKYLDRYPGDDYVDVIGFDYYDDYNTNPAEYSDQFLKNLKTSCETIKKIADKKGKVASISETGARVMKADGSDNEGILVKDNPMKGKDWYNEVNKVAKESGMSYFLLWANFGDNNFYVPYKYNDKKGQEMIDEFINFYNDESSVFADGTNFYGEASEKEIGTEESVAETSGYFTNVFSKCTIKDAYTIKASVKNVKEGEKVTAVLTGADGKVVTKELTKGENGYEVQVTANEIKSLGQTDAGTAELKAGDQVLVKLSYISYNKDKEKLPKNMVDNFELYYGDNDYLGGAFSSNSGAGASSSFVLDKDNKYNGTYGGAFTYSMKTTGSEVYTGKIKSLDQKDYTGCNAISMWVKPDGKGQKMIIQLNCNGEDFEVNLEEFAKTKDAKLVTIPFSSFKGKTGGTFDPSNISKFAVYCNSIGAQDFTDSKIVFDDIQFVNVDEKSLKLEKDGYQLADPVKKQDPTTQATPTTQAPATTQQPATSTTSTTEATKYVVTLNAKTIPLQVKKSTTKVKAVVMAGDSVAKWTTSNKKVATVDKKGKITAKKVGTAKITVTTAKGATATVTVKVQKKAVNVKKVTVNAKKLTLAAKKSYTLKTTLSPITATDKVTFKSSNKKIATVNKNGKITAKKKGKATITVKCGSKTVKVNVTVK